MAISRVVTVRTVFACLAALALIAVTTVAAAPVYASSVSNVAFTPGNTASGATSTWTVAFKTSSALTKNQDLTITFVSGFGITASPTITFDGAFGSCLPKTPQVNGQTVVVTTSGGSCSVSANTTLSLQISGITNPNPTSANSYGPTGFTVATTPDSTAQTATSAVTIAPGKLVFTTSPAPSTTAGSAFASQPVVAVQDANKNTVTSSATPIGLTVTGGGATLSCNSNTVTASNGVATFSGCKMTKAGTYTLSASATGLVSGVSAQFAVTVAAGGQLSFTQGPSDAFAGTAMARPITVQAVDPYGNSVSGLAVTLASSAGRIDAGAAATTDAGGVASFSGVVINSTGLGLTLTASAAGFSTSGASNAFNVTVQVNGSANTLTDTAADAGSGTKSVAYYYCSGYSGACTPSAQNQIRASTSSASAYSVSWTPRPTNGPYRVIAVATDNVGNVSSASGSTPVTVTG